MEHVNSAGGDVLRLVESPEPDERVGQPEMAGDHLERASRQLSGIDGPTGCNPGGVGLVLPGESRRRGLVGTGAQSMNALPFVSLVLAHGMFKAGEGAR